MAKVFALQMLIFSCAGLQILCTLKSDTTGNPAQKRNGIFIQMWG
jgi:hypothetical protein